MCKAQFFHSLCATKSGPSLAERPGGFACVANAVCGDSMCLYFNLSISLGDWCVTATREVLAEALNRQWRIHKLSSLWCY